MLKVLCFRVQQCLGPFTMLLVVASSEMGLVRHLTTFYEVRKFKNTFKL